MALREYDFEKEPTVSVVKKILTDAIKMKATDIHFDPTPDELTIRFRINGDLTEYTNAPDNVKVNILTRIKILAGMNITDSLLPQTGAISFELNSISHNMRVSSLPIVDGEKIVVHLSNYAKNLKSISKIGFNEENIKKIKELLKEQQGIILITGTTNSGKTTTTYSILKEVNSRTNNIISIEDPIKMKIKGINQVQIAPEKGLTYRNVLRSVLLQDPNIIAINELVDDETTRSALRASLTGRLVISTMHTKTAYTTIDTLLNMDVENYLLGSNLTGIISQRLVKKLCPTCRVKRKISDYEKNIIKYILGEDVEELYYPKGCEECTDGYIDQIPVEEVIKIDSELKNAISNNKKRTLIRNIIYEENESILKNGLKKAIEGETSFQEIIRIIDLKDDFTEKDKEIIDFILGNNKALSLTKKEKGANQKAEEEAIAKEEKVTADSEEKIIEEEAKITSIVEENNDEDTESKTKDKENKSKKEEKKIEEEKLIKPPHFTEVKEIKKEKKNIKEETKESIKEEIEKNNTEETIIKPPRFDEPAEDKNDEIKKENSEPIKVDETKVSLEEETPENIANNKIDTKIEIEKEIKPNEEQKNAEETESISINSKIEEKNPSIDDDDDDDDDFNYGSSYINNF